MTTDLIGGQYPQPDPRGWLVFAWLPTDLQNAEDSAQSADFERGARRWWRPFTRPATDTERQLLAHIGFQVLPEDLTTRVSFPAGGVRRRRWSQLEESEAS